MLLVYTDGENHKWKITVDDPEEAAGILAIPFVDKKNNRLISLEANFLDNYIAAKNQLNINGQILKEFKYPTEEKYYIWLRTEDIYINLFAFSTRNFIKGMIRVCNLFDLDLQDYLVSLPFDENGRFYSFSNRLLTAQNFQVLIEDIDDYSSGSDSESDSYVQNAWEWGDVDRAFEIADGWV